MTSESSRTVDALAATGTAGPLAEALAVTRIAGPVDATTVDGAGDVPSGVAYAPANLEPGAIVGRYVVLSRLGQGGMGVVFAAYDPELGRRVALKLLPPRFARDADPLAAADARTRLMREAQALAQLNHPHIVAVHDVGVHEGAVFLAMEYVEGETLSAYLAARRRSWREVLAVMTPAALGLAAAHDAGLVHRDIKPDNIMIGADGRVRVMDLGLARALGSDDGPPMVAGREALSAQVTRAGAIMGTPAYMSPEQFEGQPVDARADVFSFCVTLWEALMGERPFAGELLPELAASVCAGAVRRVPRDAHARAVPGWLRRVCLQGLAVEPRRRFASMKALLAALTRGRSRARARGWSFAALAVALLGGAAAAYQHRDRTGRVAACEQAGQSIFDDWNAEARAGVREGIIATGIAYAPVTADKVMPILDAQAAAWRDSRTRACVQAEVEGSLTAEELDRAVWCLDDRRMELVALLGELGRADPRVVQKAVTAVARLPSVSPCVDRQVLAARPPPPPVERRARADAVRVTLSRGRASLLAGKYPEGHALAREALADAEALGWPLLVAAARDLEGILLEKTGKIVAAEAASLAAYLEAGKGREWSVATSAAIELTFNVGYLQARHAEGKVWAGHAEVMIGLAGDPSGYFEASRLNNLAAIHQAAGAYAEASAAYERSLELLEGAFGPEHPDVASSLNNLGNVRFDTGAHAEARALYERSLELRERVLGPEHPDVATVINNLARIEHAASAYPEAKALYERALELRERALGPEHLEVTASLNNLGAVLFDMGAHAEARALYERALAVRERTLGPEHPAVAVSLNNLGDVLSTMGAYAEAKALHERALAIRERALGAEHSDVAVSLVNLGKVHQRTGAFAEAKVMVERALRIWEKSFGPAHAKVAFALGDLGGLALAQGRPAEALPLLERSVAVYDAIEGVQEAELENRFRLAQALVGSGGDRTRALAEARRAAADLRSQGAGAAKELARIEAFLAAHGDVTSSPSAAE